MWVVKNLLIVVVIKGRWSSALIIYYKMDDYNEETFASDFVENLIEEFEKEARVEAAWPILVVSSKIRNQVWNICESVGQSARGVPATACRLLERFLSMSSQKYLKEHRDTVSWERYKQTLGKQLYLIIVACVQLVAKNCDRVTHVPASLMRAVLLKAGIQHSKSEILAMEINVFKTLNYRLPTWTTLEIAEFLASLLGLSKDAKIRNTLIPIMNLTEYHRDVLEYHVKAWDEAIRTPGSSSSKPAGSTVHNLHMCAGVVSAAVRHLRPPEANDAAQRLAAALRADACYIKAISDVIVKRILPERKKPVTNILKRKRRR
ncbi:uncharacterized protein LOC113496185 [Trichoplusia ni]|uniref:Uncharacterized protein LOC113496185 n=1 Tax=Trichoplusia ni TaxID=7111 RepID=A0A7E5VS92_TRINI|nr:uncharacterized protein LOC113496185 [Trichoplusia ni]